MFPLSGFLLVDKPAGLTSHDVVDQVRRVAKTRAVGHAGTLDPFATGLLILGIGKATKGLSSFVGLPKTYEVVVRLGATSDTFDREGQITENAAGMPTQDEVERVLSQFRGGYEQKAPLFSAKKIKGKKLYELARAGTATEELRPSKQVEITTLHILDYQPPRLKLIVACSSGTYIRSLADDIGRALGVGAYAVELRRTKIGDYSVEQALPLGSLATDALSQALLPYDPRSHLDKPKEDA
jgi:tRNA pseudouridine55 synthase